MAKKTEDIILDTSHEDSEMIPVSNDNNEESNKEITKINTSIDSKTPFNPLRNTRIIVRYIARQRGLIDNPKHVLYGGMAETAKVTFTVPRLTSGMLVNVLTDAEKQFLEETLGLEFNALSIYRKSGNFWDGSTDNSIHKVTLTKQDNFFDLSNPEDYIRYKILLANKDFIAPSLKELKDRPKGTYRFVIIDEGDEAKLAQDKMSVTMKCYLEYGKVENNTEILRAIIETIEGKPLSPDTKLEFLQAKINDLIQSNSKLFLQTITDQYLPTVVLIKKAIELGFITKRGDYLYLSKDNTPLCQANEEPTLTVASIFLNLPKNQETKFWLEANVKQV